MTQTTNVMYILLITIIMSIIATLITIGIDKTIDVGSFVRSIPHLVLPNFL